MTYNITKAQKQELLRMYLIYGRKSLPIYGGMGRQEYHKIFGNSFSLPMNLPKWITWERKFTDKFIEEVVDGR